MVTEQITYDCLDIQLRCISIIESLNLIASDPHCPCMPPLESRLIMLKSMMNDLQDKFNDVYEDYTNINTKVLPQ